ncbi:hypothetical protein EVAR_8423_1 [Eumeta japonica]|uniref:Uncharacterized protein n=1 Tax=Eumeta variegata TaxID=151549 RepID=A0A4C1WFB6_EUMVA|nr:hypothetical protein EVAR_8423_1 [Eumeta japonica]
MHATYRHTPRPFHNPNVENSAPGVVGADAWWWQVINGAPAESCAGGDAMESPGAGAAACESRRRGASSPPPAAPEKRKWPAHPYCDPEPDADLDLDADADEAAARAPSDDDDDTKVETPVRFRTSPPLEALKPRRARASPARCACPPAPPRTGQPERAPASPRRRRRHRPALDFDKMQQKRTPSAFVAGAFAAAAAGVHRGLRGRARRGRGRDPQLGRRGRSHSAYISREADLRTGLLRALLMFRTSLPPF